MSEDYPTREGNYLYTDDGGGPTAVTLFKKDGVMLVRHTSPRSGGSGLMARGIDLDCFAGFEANWQFIEPVEGGKPKIIESCDYVLNPPLRKINHPGFTHELESQTTFINHAKALAEFIRHRLDEPGEKE